MRFDLIYRSVVASAAVLISGCTGDVDTDNPPLPSDSDSYIIDDTGPFDIPEDTDDLGPSDLDPLNYLYMYQEGSLTLSPGGGPYTTLAGFMTALELVDFQLPAETDDTDAPPDTDVPWSNLEESPVACTVTYAISGVAPDETSGAILCDGCAWMMDVTFQVTAGDPEPCYDPDLPAHEEVLRFAWHPDSGHLKYDFQNTGVWFEWFPGSVGGDTVDFTWNARVGVSIEEDDR